MAALCLKSHFEFLKGKFTKAAKVLSDWPQLVANGGNEELSLRKANASALGASIDFQEDLYYGNMACIYSRLHRHHLAAFFCQRALQLNSEQLSKAASEHGGCSFAVTS